MTHDQAVERRRHIILPRPISERQGIIIDAMQDPGILEMFVACGTKFGKTFGASCGFSGRITQRQAALGRWVAPIYAQTRIGFRYCQKILPPEPETHANLGDLSLTLMGSQSKLEYKSGQKPEDLEGEGTEVNVLDEAAKLHEQVYGSVKTTVTITRGLIAGFSTPRGKNWFHRKCVEAKDIMDWQLRMGKPLTHLFVTAPSTDNPLVTAEAIDEARRALPDRLFRQYYMAEFVDDGDVFVGFRKCIEGEELIFDGGTRQFWLHEDAAEAQVVVGADWAKTQDRTVFYAIDLVTRRCAGFMRFYRTPYTEAIRLLDVFCKRFKDVVVAKHDKTGLGGVIDDYLAQTNIPFEGVTFTNMAKADMVAKLITGVEQRDTLLPNWRELVDEFDSYEVTTGPTGNMSYAASPGKHDDIVTAVMLAYAGLLQYGDRQLTVRSLEDIAKPKKNRDGIVKEGAKRSEEPAEPAEPALLRFFRQANGIDEDDDD